MTHQIYLKSFLYIWHEFFKIKKSLNNQKEGLKNKIELSKKQNKNKPKLSFKNLPDYFIWAAVAVLGFLIYSNTYHAGFHLDDHTYILRNEMIKNLHDFAHWDVWTNIYQRPVASVTFALNYYFHEFDLPFYHLVNILIHIVTSILVYFLSLQLLNLSRNDSLNIGEDRRILSVFMALLFLAHPIQTQSVNYIVQRMTLMAALFFIAGLLSYIKARMIMLKGQPKKSIGYFILTLLLFYLASFSKQNAVVLPLIFLLTEILYIRDQQGKASKSWIYTMIVVFVATGLVVLLGGLLPKENDVISRETYFAAQTKVIFRYWQLLLFPVSQNFDPYVEISDSLTGWKELLALLGHLLILAFGMFMYRREKWITFGIFWFYITLFIESGIIPIRDVMFEHRLYLPSFGFYFILTLFLYKLTQIFKQKNRIFILSMMAIIALYSIAGFQRNKVWESDFSLWSDVVSKPPVKVRPLQYLSGEYVKMKDFEKALELLEKAEKLESDNSEIYLNKAVILQRMNKMDEAIQSMNKAIELEPDKAAFYNDRAKLYMSIGDYDKSRADILKVLELDSQNARAYFNLGVMSMKNKDDQAAISFFTEALLIEKDYTDALSNRGLAYMQLENYQAAIQDFTTILKYEPENTWALNKRASACFSDKKYKQSIEDYTKLIELEPTGGIHYYNRAIVYVRENQFTNAFDDMEQAERLGSKMNEELYQYVLKMKDFNK